MNIEAAEIASFENGVATIKKAWNGDAVTIDIKGGIVEWLSPRGCLNFTPKKLFLMYRL
jgi:hypothetical protein